jgi:acyl-CoA synthetase (NDP forming)
MNISHSTRPVDDNFWHSLFAADSIAVIGAKDVLGSWGYDAIKSAQDSAEAKAGRQVYAVNPGAKEVLGTTAYNTVLDIPGPVELAIIVVPAHIVSSVLRQCVEKKVKAAVIVSAGFSETDDEGAALEAELVKIAGEGGIRFVGPNCIGHADTHSGVHSAHVAGRVAPGRVALLSQSGTLGASIMQVSSGMGIGLSKFVSTGNEASLHLEDYLEYLSKDPDTKIISAYIEGLREARRFFELAKDITPQKPIVVMKSGATSGAGKAARSHTGALAGADEVYAAAFKQAGVIRAEDEEELCDILLALLNQPLPRGNRVAILTMGGGFGVVTSEVCEKEGLTIAPLEAETLEKLNSVLPPRWSHSNPIDLVGIRPAAGDTTVESCFRFLMEDKNIDTVISLLPPMVTSNQGLGNFDPAKFQDMQADSQKILRDLNRELKPYGKPLYMVGRLSPQRTQRHGTPSLQTGDTIPEYSHPRRAARVIGFLARYRKYLEDRKIAVPLFD